MTRPQRASKYGGNATPVAINAPFLTQLTAVSDLLDCPRDQVVNVSILTVASMMVDFPDYRPTLPPPADPEYYGAAIRRATEPLTLAVAYHLGVRHSMVGYICVVEAARFDVLTGKQVMRKRSFDDAIVNDLIRRLDTRFTFSRVATPQVALLSAIAINEGLAGAKPGGAIETTVAAAFRKKIRSKPSMQR